MEKWLMPVQNASKSCEYFKTRKIDFFIFENLENLSNLNQNLNLIDIDSKCEKIIVFLSKMNFSVQGLGDLFGHKKRVPFVVAYAF